MTTKAQLKSAEAPVEAPRRAPGTFNRRLAVGAVSALILAIGVLYGFRRWQFFVAHEETDDAQVEGHISPVLPRVSGYVARVLVDDNQRVKAGQALVEIDSKELDLRVSGAEAALRNAQADRATAQASLGSAGAALATAAANVETALVRQHKAAHDLERDSRLFSTGAITDSQLSDTQAAADTAAAVLESVRSEARAAEAQVGVAKARVAAAETRVAELASDLDLARLQRSYAEVTAPIDGRVSRKSVEPGQYVQAGQTLLSVASETDVWVVANFKETQLARMRPGQDAEFEADTYRGYVFHGRVESISGATGARFALLPPDNSTGNFVKVTQRVPVKIVLAQPPDAGHPLRPGVSVDAVVSVGN
jgi:membrane fusion protein (multidrug efflux system)